MRIKSVELKNFLSHGNTVVNFNGRINVIIGHNGAGKSSIIDGILFALFREGSRGSNKNLVKMGSRAAAVKLTLTDAQGRDIVVERHIPDSTGDLLIIDQTARARGAEKVTEEVQKLINIDKDVLLSTLVVRQGEIESIFKEFTDVMKKIMKIENLEKLTDSSGPIYTKIKEIQNKLNQIQTFEKEYTDTNNKLFNLKIEKNKIEEELNNLRKSEKDLNEKLQEARRLFEEAQRKREEYVSLASKRSQLLKEMERVKARLAQLAGAEEEKASIEEKIKELKRYEEAKALIDQLRGLEKDIARIKANVEKAVRERDEIKEKLRRKEELKSDYLSYVDNKKKLEALEEEEKEYNKALAVYNSLQREISNIERALSSLKVVDVSQMEEELNRIEEEINELNNRKGALTVQIKEAEKVLGELSNVKGGQCPVCRRPLDEYHKLSLIQEARALIQTSKEELGKISARLSELSRRREDLRRQIDRANKNNVTYKSYAEKKTELERQLQEISSRLKELEKAHEEYTRVKETLSKLEPAYREYLKLSEVSEEDLKEKEEEINSLNEQLEEKTSKKREVEEKLAGITPEQVEEKLKELEKLQKRLEEVLRKLGERSSLLARLSQIEREVEELEVEIRKLNYSEEEYQLAKEKVEELTKKLLDTSKRISEDEGKLNQIVVDIEEKERRLKELDAILGEKPKLEKALKKLNKLRDDLGEKGLQGYIIAAVKSRIENNLNDIASMFNLSYTRVALDFTTSTRGQKVKANLSVYDNYGREYSVEMLSGGERISIALALRLAIAKSLMDSLGFVILDEPTIHLDEERRKELMNVIRGALDVVPQIIVVTHDDEVLEIGDYVIRVEKKGSESKVWEEVPGND